MITHEIKRLGSSVLTYGVGQVLMRTLSLVLLPVFTTYLTPTEYGVSSILAILTLIAIPVFSLGLGAGMGPCYFEGADPRRKAATIYTTSGILVISAALLVVIALLFDEAISTLAFETAQHGHLVRLTLLSASCTVLAGPFMQYLQFEERARLYVALTGATTALTVGLSVLFIVAFHRGLLGMIEANAIGQLASLAMFATVFLARERARPSKKLAAELLRLGVVLIPAFAFQFLLQQSNKYVLQQLRDLATVGIYTIGSNIGMAMSMLVGAFGNAWYAYFMRFVNDRNTARSLFARLTTAYILAFGTIASMFFIFAKPVIMILTQPAYIDATLIVGFSASAQFLNGLYLMLLPGLYFEKKVKYITVVYAIASIVGLALNVLLIGKWGLLGAGIGLALGQITLVASQYLCNLVMDDLRIPYEWGRIGVFSLLYIAVAAASLWRRQLPLAVEAMGSIAVAAGMIALVYALLGDEDRRLVGQLLARMRRTVLREAPAAIVPDAPSQ